MSQKNTLDDFLKEKLGKPTVPYSSADWDRMEELLEDDHKGVLVFWLFRTGIAVALIVLCVLSYSVLKKGNKPHLFSKGQNTSASSIIKESPKWEEAFAQKRAKNLSQTSRRKNENIIFGKSQIFPKRNPYTQIKGKNKLYSEPWMLDNLDFMDSEIMQQTEVFTQLVENEKSDLKMVINWQDAKWMNLVNEMKVDTTWNIPEKVDDEDSLWSAIVLTPHKPPVHYFMSVYAGNFAYAKQKVSSELYHIQTDEIPFRVTNYGLDFGVQLGDWALKLGLGQTVIRENTNYKSFTYATTYDTSYAIIKRTYTTTPSGNNISLIKKEIKATTDSSVFTSCKDCETRISYVNVPLVVQYQKSFNRFKLFGELGFTTSFLQNQKGLYTINQGNVDGQIVYEVGLLSADYLTNVLYQPHVSTGAKFTMFNNINVFTLYNYTISLNSIMKSYDQKLITHGLKFGIEYKF